jgi:hypothetical protein
VVIDKIDYNPEKREVQRFVETKRKISVYLGSKYQYIGNLIEFNEDHEFVDPPQPAAEALAPEADPFGFVKDEYKASVKEVRKQRVKYELDKQQSYSIVWGLCTVAMQNMLKSVEGFDDTHRERDLLTLWNEIQRLSTVGADFRRDPDVLKLQATRRFQGIRQYPDESPGDFYNRYNVEVEIWESAGNEFIESFIPEGEDPALVAAREVLDERTEKAKAMDFLSKLDKRRFSGLLDAFHNTLTWRTGTSGRQHWKKLTTGP